MFNNHNYINNNYNNKYNYLTANPNNFNNKIFSYNSKITASKYKIYIILTYKYKFNNNI